MTRESDGNICETCSAYVGEVFTVNDKNNLSFTINDVNFRIR